MCDPIKMEDETMPLETNIGDGQMSDSPPVSAIKLMASLGRLFHDRVEEEVQEYTSAMQRLVLSSEGECCGPTSSEARPASTADRDVLLVSRQQRSNYPATPVSTERQQGSAPPTPRSSVTTAGILQSSHSYNRPCSCVLTSTGPDDERLCAASLLQLNCIMAEVSSLLERAAGC